MNEFIELPDAEADAAIMGTSEPTQHGLTREEGRALLRAFRCCELHKKGDPIRKGGKWDTANGKEPKGKGWQNSRLPADAYRGQGVGVVCGPVGGGGLQVGALDFDILHPEAAREMRSWMASWAADKNGDTLIRVGLPPKFLIPFQLTGGEALKGRKTKDRHDAEGRKAQLEILGRGNQFAAYQTHPDTGQPYQWGRLEGTSGFLDELHLTDPEELLELTPEDLQEIEDAFERIMGAHGIVRAEKAPTRRGGAGEVVSYKAEGFFANVKRSAMANFERWVPAMFPAAVPYQGGFRVTSAALGRDLVEDLAFHPDGIHDFGTEEGLTPLDAVLRYCPNVDGQRCVHNAAFWLCDQLGIKAEALGWTATTADELAEWRGLQLGAEFDAADEVDFDPAWQDALLMAKEIGEAIGRELQLGDGAAITVDPEPLHKVVRGAFWSPNNAAVWHVTPRGNLVQHKEADAWAQLEASYGKAVDPGEIEELLGQLDTGHREGTIEEAKAQEKIAKRCRQIPRQVGLFYLKRENQRTRVARRVDMFATKAEMILQPDKVTVIETHRDFPEGEIDPAVTEDYLEHYPRFLEFLHFLAAARFASDRKKAYLWMRLLSDWGKDLLLDGILGADGLGLVAGVSEAEVEKMFEGAPVGRDPVELLHAWVLWINEFKKVNGEIKQLERSVRLAPKHQLTAEVPIYAKIFTSAEGVESLAGDHGVEDQFANRFSIYDGGEQRITQRALFNADRAHYLESLRNYAASVLNAEVRRYRAMGWQAASNAATASVEAFQRQHGIGEALGRLEERVPEIADQIREELLAPDSWRGESLVVGEGKAVLPRPAAFLDQWIRENISRSEQRTIGMKKAALYEAISVDGKGNTAHKIFGTLTRGVRLR